MHTGSNSLLMNLIHVLHMVETVYTDRQYLSTESFSDNTSLSLSLIRTIVNFCHIVSFCLDPGLRLFGSYSLHAAWSFSKSQQYTIVS